jgi:hypothetical protein
MGDERVSILQSSPFRYAEMPDQEHAEVIGLSATDPEALFDHDSEDISQGETVRHLWAIGIPDILSILPYAVVVGQGSELIAEDVIACSILDEGVFGIETEEQIVVLKESCGERIHVRSTDHIDNRIWG